MAWVVSAVITAVEVMTAAAIFTAVAEVGIALQVVGAVTKSKDLMKIGGIMGAVGVVGGLASAGFSALTGAAGEVGVAEGAAAAAGEVTGEQLALQGGMDAAGAGGLGAAVDGAVQTFPVDLGLEGLSGGGMLQSGAAAAPAAAGAIAPGAAAAGMPAGRTAAEMFNESIASSAAPAGAFDLATVGAVAAPADTTSFGISKWFSGLDKATQGKVMSGAMQIGGAAMGGLFNGWSEEQKLALERERQALAQKNIDTQQANANAQPKVAAYARPTGMMGA